MALWIFRRSKVVETAEPRRQSFIEKKRENRKPFVLVISPLHVFDFYDFGCFFEGKL